MEHKVAVVLVLLETTLFAAGCISGDTAVPLKDTVFDVRPVELTIKSDEPAQVMVRVKNNGKSVIHPFIRFNTNTQDKPYVKFSNESGSYDMGVLRPGEDTGFRIVDFRAALAAGKEMKYQVRAQVLYNGGVLESKDIIITVKK